MRFRLCPRYKIRDWIEIESPVAHGNKFQGWEKQWFCVPKMSMADSWNEDLQRQGLAVPGTGQGLCLKVTGVLLIFFSLTMSCLQRPSVFFFFVGQNYTITPYWTSWDTSGRIVRKNPMPKRRYAAAWRCQLSAQRMRARVWSTKTDVAFKDWCLFATASWKHSHLDHQAMIFYSSWWREAPSCQQAADLDGGSLGENLSLLSE